MRNKVFVSIYLIHQDSYSESTIDLAVLHQIPSDNALAIITGFIDIFSKVDLDISQSHAVTTTSGREFLKYFKRYVAFLEHVVAIYGEFDG